jgi:hypothetical protein
MTARAPAIECSSKVEARPSGIRSGLSAGTWNALHPRRSIHQPYREANGVHPRSVLGVVVVFAVVLVLVASTMVAWPRDLDGRYANSPLKQWFDQLASRNGLCCSFADGFKIEDVDWDTQDGHYRVRLHGEWIVVPDPAVVTEPNRFGPAVVWPYQDVHGNTQIRCFIPGSGA